MAQQTINIGTTANDGTGDPLRTAFDKANDNFNEIYADDFVTATRITDNVQLDGTESVGIPAGTTAERPSVPAAGMLRYNTTTNEFEGYTTEWGAIGGGEAATLYVDTFTGDGTTVDFTASQSIDTENSTQIYIDGVYQSKDNYSISGTTVTFTTAPPNGTSIEMLHIKAVVLTTVADGVVSFAKLDSGTVVTESEGIASNDSDTTIPTSAAVKDYVDVGVSVISTNTTAVSGNLYVFTANLTLTLPLSPSVGDYIKFSNRSGVATCVIARNGENIMGSATDLTIDKLDAGLELIYTGAAQGWILIGTEGI